MMEPLEGVRVLDFSRQLAGPAGTRVLANYGAEVLRAEWSEAPGVDFLRFGTFGYADGVSGLNRSAHFNGINVGKKSFTLNMATDGGREIARELIKLSDVVYESMTPRVMKSWGLDYETARSLREDIIYVSCSGFGHTGPAASYRSYGATSVAHSGILHLAGISGSTPAGWSHAIGDTHAGMMNAITVLAALAYRRRTGRGLFIDSAQTQGNITLLGQYFLERSANGTLTRRAGFPPGNRRLHPKIAPHGVYPCLVPDSWCAIAVHSEAEWQALQRVMGNPDWASAAEYANSEGRYTHQDTLDKELGEWTIHFDKKVLAARLQKAGVRAGAVQNVRDRIEWDPQLSHRGTYGIFDHPEVGPRRHETVGAKLSKNPYQQKPGSPQFGADNDYVFRTILGFSDDRIAALVADDVIRY